LTTNDLSVNINELKENHRNFVLKASKQLHQTPCRIESFGPFVKVNWLIGRYSYMWKPAMGNDLEVRDNFTGAIGFYFIN